MIPFPESTETPSKPARLLSRKLASANSKLHYKIITKVIHVPRTWQLAFVPGCMDLLCQAGHVSRRQFFIGANRNKQYSAIVLTSTSHIIQGETSAKGVSGESEQCPSLHSSGLSVGSISRPTASNTTRLLFAVFCRLFDLGFLFWGEAVLGAGLGLLTLVLGDSPSFNPPLTWLVLLAAIGFSGLGSA